MRLIQALVQLLIDELSAVFLNVLSSLMFIHKYTVFNQELSYVIERVGNLFSLNVNNLCFDCPLLNIERVLFSHTVSRKDLSKTFLVLV